MVHFAAQNTQPGSAETVADRQATAHYGDPCLYCRVAHDDVASGPCPARAGNKAGTRIPFLMSQADFDGIIAAINSARSTPLIMLNVGTPRSPLEAANDAWCALGRRLGFDGMTVRPNGANQLSFTAVATGGTE